MPDFIVSNGYLYLFALSFLAATVIPVGSEWLLVALLLKSLDPAWLLVSATSGNTLGAWTTYLIGRHGGPFLTRRVLRISDESLDKAARRYRKYGSWSLLLSWLPIVGDPLCLVGGLFRTRVATFLILVLIGKAARYGFVVWVTLKAVG
jgi:membrane protein YqaA with SNARE-associated domain